MNRTVLITGASSGIGLELAKLFAKRGWNLALVARRKERLEKLALKLSERRSISAGVIARDLSAPSSPEEIFNELKRKAIHIDILVNSAGFNEAGPFCETSIEKELQMLQVHIASLTHLTKLFLPGMIKNKFGRILNIGSTGSFAPCPLDAVYCASKAYVLSFSNALRAELRGTGVTVSTLCPGATQTEFAEKAAMQNTLLFKSFVMNPEDVAEIAYHGLMRNTKVIVPGIYNRLLVSFFPITPARVLEKVSTVLLKRR